MLGSLRKASRCCAVIRSCGVGNEVRGLGRRFSGSLLPKNPANYVPLTPISLLERSVRLYPDRTAYVVYDKKHDVDRLVTWQELDTKLRRFSSALLAHGLKALDVVSVLAPNCPLLLDAHYSVMAAKGILHCVNIRLDATSIAFQLKHAKSTFLIVDSELQPLAIKALELLEASVGKDLLPVLILEKDPAYYDDSHPDINDKRYTFLPFGEFMQKGTTNFDYIYPDDEWDGATLNYTSGTTGDPKGVVYHHRGAYLNSISLALDWNMCRHPRFLWGKRLLHYPVKYLTLVFVMPVVPLFHANGW
jgi:fatty-acyl-CoA synthase